MTWHLHRWSQWEPTTRGQIDRRTGIQWRAPFQFRTCLKCGKRQEEAL